MYTIVSTLQGKKGITNPNERKNLVAEEYTKTSTTTRKGENYMKKITKSVLIPAVVSCILTILIRVIFGW